MSLISAKYILLLLIAVICYYISPKKYRWVILLISSYIFYYLSSSKLLIFLLISTISIYLAGLLIVKENAKLNVELEKEEKKILKQKVKKNKKLILLLTIILNFGILIILKYINFLGRGINSFLDLITSDINFPIFNFVLPLGISYYTLQAVSYIVDVYRDKYQPTKNLGKVALFTSFFPLITEGPISKYDELADQLYEPNKFTLHNILLGATLILIGFAKKLVIADRAGIFVNDIFGSSASGGVIFLAAIFYTLQIYAEFSGCMDIVSGSAKLFGVNVAQNFRQPFFSKNVQEFWQRWHITLGAWIKEYIFYPISLSKMANKVSMFARKHLKENLSKFIAVAFPLLFVWLFNGIWHGASIKYISYGIYYYLIIMIGLLFAPLSQKLITKYQINTKSRLYKLFQITRTCILVVFGMMLFRSANLTEFFTMFKNLLNSSTTSILNHGLVTIDFIVLIISALVLLVTGIFKEKGTNIYEKFKRLNFFYQILIYILIIMIIVIFGIYGEGYNVSDFIYGQF